MDPAVQPNINSVNNKILPGQFVQIGEEPQNIPTPNINIGVVPTAQFKMPDSSATVGVVSSEPAPIEAPNSAPSIAPILHLATKSAEVGTISSQPAPIPPPATPADLPAAQPVSPLPQGHQQPDPTPFFAPGMPESLQSHVQPPKELAKHSKSKVLMLTFGGLALIGIVTGLSYFFVFNKNLPLGAKVEDTIKSQLEDLPPLPKRIKGGFADLSPIQVFFAQTASPSATPEINIPAY